MRSQDIPSKFETTSNACPGSSGQSPLSGQTNWEAAGRAHYAAWLCAAAKAAPTHPMSVLSSGSQQSIYDPMMPNANQLISSFHGTTMYENHVRHHAKNRKCVCPMPSALISASIASTFICAFGIVKAKSSTWSRGGAPSRVHHKRI